MRIRLVSAVVVAFVASLTGQAQEKLENPFKNAKVGDFVQGGQVLVEFE